MIVIKKSDFDAYAIRHSGQVFLDFPCEIIEEQDKVIIRGKDEAWLRNFFDIDTDYGLIKKELSQFDVLKKPIESGGGIRILRQPFAQTLISFIISANNNIKRFTKTIEQIDFGNLSEYSEQDFKNMGCGYRAPYLVKTIKQLETTSFDELKKLDNAELRKKLMTFAGVGRKVADCVMLFAFHRLDVAPVDTWIKKAMEQLDPTQAEEIFNHKYAGVAQQYIFYYLQHEKKRLG